MTLLERPWVQRRLRGYLLCNVPAARRCFSLTFDDGPSPRNTPRLLEVLERHGARATFFLLASRVRRHPELARRIAAERHEIGIHGDTHLPAWSLPRRWLTRDVDRAVAAVRDACGRTPRHYRAPFGLLLPSQADWLRAHGLVAVLGSVYPRDHAAGDPRVIARRVVTGLESGAIVILHDSSVLGDMNREPTVTAVDEILTRAAERDLRCVPVAELVRLAEQETSPPRPPG